MTNYYEAGDYECRCHICQNTSPSVITAPAEGAAGEGDDEG